MIKDLNKGIGTAGTNGIVYNHLNLPTLVTISNTEHNGNIQYIYDATGAKLEKIATEGSSVTSTKYAGNYIYEDSGTGDALKFFNQAEGYVEPMDASDYSLGFEYVYQYKDHLGNIRISYKNVGSIATPSLEIQEENNYYPFGLEHKGYNNVVNGTENNYKTFLGQEMNKELGLNWLTFRYRNYMPEIGRFFGVDPISEEFLSISTYQFAHNSPIWKIELEGLEGYALTGFDNSNFEPVVGNAFVGHTMLPTNDYSSGSSVKTNDRKYLISEKLVAKNTMVTGYPGQALDEAVTAGIQWIGSKLTGSDVSKGTSENIQLGTNLLIFITSKGKNGKAGAELTEQFLKKNGDDLADGITGINKKFSSGAQLNEGGLESAINSASYYDDIAEQGTSVFNSIVKGHVFTNGNKRTASEFITQFAKDNNLKINLNASQLKDLTSDMANGVKSSIEDLSKKIFGGTN